MDATGLLLSYSAGLVAAVNPCGFALLPAYLGLLVVGDDTPSRGRAVARAAWTSAVMTSAFVGVFLVFGLVISPVASSAQRHLPWLTLLLGLGLLLTGLWLATGRSLPGIGVRLRGTRVRRGVGPVLLYGIGYAAASLTCTIAPFLAVVVSAFRGGSTGAGILYFAAYAVGMGTVVTVAAVAVALASSSVLTTLRRSGARTGRLVGVLLVVVGGYVAWYGAWEVRVLDGADADDPVVSTALDVQSRLAGLVEAGGLAWLLALAVILSAVVLLRRRRSWR